MSAIRDCFHEAEQALRSEFGTEKFKLKKTYIDGRASNGDLGIDFDDDGARSGNSTVRAIFFKEDYPGRPKMNAKITWCSEDGEKVMRIEGIDGVNRTSPTWKLDLREL